MVNDFEDLLKFINTHDNWIELLKKKPYSLKSIRQSAQNPNWYILMYNLFERESLKLNEVLATRGTVVEYKDGVAKVVCAPFFKFFNYGEGECEDIDLTDPKTFITQKRDGWICKAAKYNGKLYWFTQSADLIEDNSVEVVSPLGDNKGLSFKNIYEVWKYAWDREDHSFVDKLPDGCTLVFELESAWNQIHTKSQFEPKLWFIGYRDENLMEHRVHELEDLVPFEIPKHYELSSWKDVKALLDTWNGEELEGIVACQPMPNGHFKRAKIKCDDYLRIKMEAQFKEGFVPTRRNIFNIVVNEEFDDLMPFLGEDVKNQILDMAERFNAMKEKCRSIAEEVIKNVPKSDTYYKDCALYLNEKGYGPIKVVFNAIKSDFNTSWNNFVEEMRQNKRVGWKNFSAYEEKLL